MSDLSAYSKRFLAGWRRSPYRTSLRARILVTGKKTGKFAKGPAPYCIGIPDMAENSAAFDDIPSPSEQGISEEETGKTISSNREFFLWFRTPDPLRRQGPTRVLCPAITAVSATQAFNVSVSEFGGDQGFSKVVWRRRVLYVAPRSAATKSSIAIRFR
jgi:hypothetical protein